MTRIKPRTVHLAAGRIPSGSRVIVMPDIHAGIHDAAACSTMLAAATDWGVTHVIFQGDAVNCLSVSPHPKSPAFRDTLREEVDSASEVWAWADKRQVWFIEGNHEDWVNDVVMRNPGLYGSTSFPELSGLDRYDWAFLPHGGQVRIGGLVIEHGDLIFPRGGGPKQAAAAALTKFPDQHTIFGHVHRAQEARRTSLDSRGVPRTRLAMSVGHMSHPEAHEGYMGRAPDWQQSFILLDTWWDGPNFRFHPYQVEVLRDRRNRPTFKWNGKVYR